MSDPLVDAPPDVSSEADGAAPGGPPAPHLRLAVVAVNRPIHTLYTYSVPEALDSQVVPGARVSLRFGRQEIRGVVIERVDGPAPEGFQVRDLDGVLDPLPLLAGGLIELGRLVAGHYMCALGEVLDAFAPAPTPGPRPRERFAVPAGEAAAAAVPARAVKQRQLLLLLARHPGGLDRESIRSQLPGAQNLLGKLVESGHVTVTREIRGRAIAELLPTEEFRSLTPAQTAVWDPVSSDLDSGRFAEHLIHGVTGAGKTEVYLHLMKRCLDQGRGAIFLVPEIALTIPMRERVIARFGSQVALLHSGLAPAERYREWLAIATGEKLLAVGARSAVFAPLPKLGLVVIDEEPESSYKQEDRPSYHAREVARWRCGAAGAVLVLGSATPSLETYHRARSGQIGYHRITRRFNEQALPHVRVVDLSDEYVRHKNRSVLSMGLKAELTRVLEAGGQALLFLNRRGHSTYVFCQTCGKALECRDCSVALTYHQTHGRLVCHMCGLAVAPPAACPACQEKALRFGGGGTQRVEEEFRTNFPDVPARRMDSDTTSRRGSHEEIIEEFASKRTRVLIGTQMVAKGFDFPDLDLVGVINADGILHLSDFRGAERTFQIVTQVAGRAGRGTRPGLVLLQTFSPGHYALKAALAHDYDGFAAQELPQRELLGYPPFMNLIRIMAEADDEASPREALGALKAHIEAGPAARLRVRALGPSPSRVLKVMNRFRYGLLLKVPLTEAAFAEVRVALTSWTAPRAVAVRIDVDPQL